MSTWYFWYFVQLWRPLHLAIIAFPSQLCVLLLYRVRQLVCQNKLHVLRFTPRNLSIRKSKYFIPEYEEHRDSVSTTEHQKLTSAATTSLARAVDGVASPAPSYEVHEIIANDSRRGLKDAQMSV